jgi:hemerythrin-like domain-containing protein
MLLSVMNAIDLLQHDHKRIRRILRDLTETPSPAERADLYDLAEDALQTHSAIEEDYFYDAVRAAAGTAYAEELFIKSREEHKLVDVVFPHLRLVSTRSENFAAKARLTRELVEHHIGNEERELFPLAEEVLSQRQLEDLGERMERSKRLLAGKVILASQNRMLDCDSDGFKLVTPFFTVTSGVGCGPYRIGIPYWMRGGLC